MDTASNREPSVAGGASEVIAPCRPLIPGAPPGWSDFRRHRQRFLDAAAVDATLDRIAQSIPPRKAEGRIP
jgi:hypothetical protein